MSLGFFFFFLFLIIAVSLLASWFCSASDGSFEIISSTTYRKFCCTKLNSYLTCESWVYDGLKISGELVK